MNTIGQVISDVSTELVANKNIDQFISPRYIFSKLLDSTHLLLRQKDNFKKLSRGSYFVDYLDCNELIRDVNRDCCGEKIVTITKESVKTFNSIGGDGIMYVTSPDDNIDFDRVSSFRDFALSSRRRFGKNTPKYLVDSSGKVVILGATPKRVNITVLRSPSDVIDAFESNAECSSIYNIEFPCPEDLMPYVKQQAFETIANSLIYRIKEDENPNVNKNIVN